MILNKEKIISYNIKTYDKLYKKYEAEHGDIYNPIEQVRLEGSLRRILGNINRNSNKIKCLDFGCGAGNITKHLLNIGAKVYAADTSKNFLSLVEKRFEKKYPGKLKTILLNGKDIGNINDGSFDFIITYSVLHHIPDYLKIISEFCRILRPGGWLLIDHELSPDYWIQSEEYRKFTKEVKKNLRKKNLFKRALHLMFPIYWYYAIKVLLNPRFRIEGDIHVFYDDHIEWSEIKKILVENSFNHIEERDYLLCRRDYPIETYNYFKNRCNDIRCLLARK